MQFKVGEPLSFEGRSKDIRNQMFELSVDLVRQGKTVLIIDTLNCLNPHHRAFKTPMQRELFRKIYCVRSDKPYDLLHRLSTAEPFIRDKKIDALLITSLCAPFAHAQKEEVLPLLAHLKKLIEFLTKKYYLMTAFGTSHLEEETSRMAFEALSHRNIAEA